MQAQLPVYVWQDTQYVEYNHIRNNKQNNPSTTIDQNDYCYKLAPILAYGTIIILAQMVSSMLFKRFKHSFWTPYCNRAAPSKYVWLMNKLFQLNLFWFFSLLYNNCSFNFNNVVYFIFVFQFYYFFSSFNAFAL